MRDGTSAARIEKLQRASELCSRRAEALGNFAAPREACSAPVNYVHGAQMRVGKLAARHGKYCVAEVRCAWETCGVPVNADHGAQNRVGKSDARLGEICCAPANVVHGAQKRVGKLAVRLGKLAARQRTLEGRSQRA